jgi:hypothetical protein
MTAVVALRGRRYVEDRDTTEVVGGSKSSERRSEQRWTFALDDDRAATVPWRLAAVGDM